MTQVKAHARKTKIGRTVRVKPHTRSKSVKHKVFILDFDPIANNEEVKGLIEHYDEFTTSDLQGCVDVIAKKYALDSDDVLEHIYKVVGQNPIYQIESPLTKKIDKLSQFSGTAGYFYNPLFKNIKYTDGVKYLSDEIAGWLVTDILAVAGSKFKTSEFMVWELSVKDRKATLTAREDAGQPAKYTQRYASTDLPDGKIKLYQQNGVLMLPSEY